MNLEKMGRIAFYIGLIISVAAGFMDVGEIGLAALVVLGIIVGGLNVTGKEVHGFLMATVALVVAGLAVSQFLGSMVGGIVVHFTAFVAGAALLVALREVYNITKSA